MNAPMQGACRDVQLTEAAQQKRKTSDFEEWLVWQSNVMLNQNLEHQQKRYGADDDWHASSDAQPYRAKA